MKILCCKLCVGVGVGAMAGEVSLFPANDAWYGLHGAWYGNGMIWYGMVWYVLHGIEVMEQMLLSHTQSYTAHRFNKHAK